MRNQRGKTFILSTLVVLVFLVIYNHGFGMAPFQYYLPLVVNGQIQSPIPVGPVGGTFTALVVDPNHGRIVYAGSYVSGVYKTTDEGNTWYRMNSGLGNLKIQSLAMHPFNSNIVYTGTYGGGVYKSTNAGVSWSATNGGVLGNHIVYDLEIDPNNPTVIYAATRVNPSLKGYLFKSTNSGASWTLLLNGDNFPTVDYFYDVDVNPRNSQELYLTAHAYGFNKSTNGGKSFYPINAGITDFSARSFALDPAHPGLIYGGVWHDDAVYRTLDSGAAWYPSRNGLLVNTAVFRLYTDPFGGSSRRVFACTYGFGLYSSDDLAQSWTSRGLAGLRLYDFIVTNSSTPRWFAATESNGVYRTNAGSMGWKTVMGDLRLNAVTAFAKDETLQKDYVGVYGKGVYEVDESGLIWIDVTELLADKDVIDVTIHDGLVNVLTETGLYVLIGKEWQTITLPMNDSRDTTLDLRLLAEKVGLPAETVGDHIEQHRAALFLQGEVQVNVQPYRLITDKGNLYLSTLNSGLFLRVGNTWQQIDSGGDVITDLTTDIITGEMTTVRCDPQVRCNIFLDSIGTKQQQRSDFSVNQLLDTSTGMLAATDKGLYRIDDFQQPWVLVAGQNQEILSIATNGNCSLAAAGKGILVYSNDCGATWKETLLDDWHFQTIGYLGNRTNQLSLGSRENGAAVLPLP